MKHYTECDSFTYAKSMDFSRGRNIFGLTGLTVVDGKLQFLLLPKDIFCDFPHVRLLLPIITDADTCTGDGGGPLMCPTDEYYQDFRGESIPIYEQAGVAFSLSDVKSVSKVLGKMSDSRT